MVRGVTIEHEPANTEVPSGGVPAKRHGHRKGGRKVLHHPVPDVRVVSGGVPDADEGQGVGGRQGRAAAPARRNGTREVEDHFHLTISPIDWEACSIKDGQQAIIDLMRILEEGRKTLRRREAEDQQRHLTCANPQCLRPLASARAAVSMWTHRDPATGIEQTRYVCSQRCHAIVQHFQAGERVIKT